MSTTDPGPFGSLSGVSCTSSSFCVAVGGYDNSGTSQTLADEWNGSSWSTMTTTNPSSTSNYLGSVSCISASFCVAVDFYENSSGNAQTLAEEWNGSSWTTMSTTNPDTIDWLSGVSCTSADFCVAVGTSENCELSPEGCPSPQEQTLAEEWNGSSWSTMTTTNTASGGSLSGVSCTSASFCLAIGNPTQDWNGSSWSTMLSLNLNDDLFGVSCTSSSFCVAVGYYLSDGQDLTAAEEWNGSSWSTMTTTNPGTTDVFRDVSCTTASFCMAVGVYINPPRALAEEWNGSSWSTMTTSNPGTTDDYLYGVSCGAPGLCVAVGYSSNNNNDAYQSLAEGYNLSAPTASISSPTSGRTYALGQIVHTSFSCTEGAGGPGIASCLDSNGSASPGSLDTASPGNYTYTVTATSEDGQTGSSSITYKVAAAPTASMSPPTSGNVYGIGQVVATSFNCTEGAYGPGISTCIDSNGSTSPGTLDTSTPGSHTYTVTATSEDGQTGTTSITYTVAAAPTASISWPAGGDVYTLGQVVNTSFSCTEGAGGPGIASCLDSNGSASPGTLQTASPGNYTYTVTATSQDGQTGTASTSYTVAATPTAAISSPTSGNIFAIGQRVGTNFSCNDGAYGPGISTCLDSNGSTSPGTLNTSAVGNYTYTVTATSLDGQTGSASITYTVAHGPMASISSPANGNVYAVDQVVPTAFSCTDGAEGPGISTCLDSNGSTSPGTLNTSAPGNYTYTVTATSLDGQTGTASITYTVADPPTASISSPTGAEAYTFDEVVPTSFSCAEGTDGPGLASCLDSNGSSNPGALNTSIPGNNTYTVTATSLDGQTGTASISYSVSPASQTITITSTSPPLAIVRGPSYTVTATGGGSGNPVTFSSGTSSVCTVSGSTVSFVGPGTCVIDANQAGNSDYLAAPQAQQSFSVGQGSQTITFTSMPPSPAIVRGPTYTVTVTGGASGNPVTLSSATPPVCTVMGSTVSFVRAGTCTVEANQAGNADYSAAPTVTQSFGVENGPDVITSANSESVTAGQMFSFLVTTTGTPAPRITEKGKLPNGVMFHNGTGTATLSGTPASTKHKSAVGTYHLTIKATFGAGASKVVVAQAFTLTVTS